MSDPPGSSSVPSALEHQQEIARRLADKRAVVFLDYDGTLTPIVERPQDAQLAAEMRAVLRRLASHCPVAIISGRDRADVEQLVDVPELVYAGSHGFDIRGPGDFRMEQSAGVACLPELDAAEQQLRQRLGPVAGVEVERKRFAIAVHYRRAAEQDVLQVERLVEQVQTEHPQLRKRGGKKIFELQPDIDWDKGRAVLWLLEVLGLNTPDVLPLYLGDDLTDEDAFRALADRGLGIMVGDFTPPTAAHYGLRDTDQVQQFLTQLLQM